MHVHYVWDGSADPVASLRAQSRAETVVEAVQNARRQLRAGVTTVRDVGSTDDVAITVGAAIREGQIPGPRTFASGRTIIITGGHDPFWGIESDGVDAVRSAVRTLRSRGADLIKVSATGGVYGQAVGEDPGASELSFEELDAVVDEAHRFDLQVAAHAVGTEGIRNAVEAGVDTVEHGNLMDDETLSLLIEKDVAYDPTVFIYRDIARSDSIPGYAAENARSVYERHAEVFARAVENDARIVAGSDAGSPNLPHPGLHRARVHGRVRTGSRGRTRGHDVQRGRPAGPPRPRRRRGGDAGGRRRLLAGPTRRYRCGRLAVARRERRRGVPFAARMLSRMTRGKPSARFGRGRFSLLVSFAREVRSPRIERGASRSTVGCSTRLS